MHIAVKLFSRDFDAGNSVEIDLFEAFEAFFEVDSVKIQDGFEQRGSKEDPAEDYGHFVVVYQARG